GGGGEGLFVHHVAALRVQNGSFEHVEIDQRLDVGAEAIPKVARLGRRCAGRSGQEGQERKHRHGTQRTKGSTQLAHGHPPLRRMATARPKGALVAYGGTRLQVSLFLKKAAPPRGRRRFPTGGGGDQVIAASTTLTAEFVGTTRVSLKPALER